MYTDYQKFAIKLAAGKYINFPTMFVKTTKEDTIEVHNHLKCIKTFDTNGKEEIPMKPCNRSYSNL